MNVVPKLSQFRSNTIISDYLQSCGITDTQHYLHPNRKLFEPASAYDNIDEGCHLLYESILQQKLIYILHDSDQDGDYSSALIYNFMQKLGASPIVLFHAGKQHGLQHNILKSVSNDSLIFIPDASCSEDGVIQEVNKKHCKIIETDHHCTTHENKSIITINNIRSPKVKNKSLSGTGVTDKFVQRYCELFDIKKPNYDDLVAMSLVSDICDLSNMENRAYMYYGLKTLTNPFLAYLFEKCCKRRGKTPDAIGWDIGPLGNALARSDEQDSKTLFFDGLVGNLDPEDALKKMRRIKRIQDDEVKSVVNEIEPNLDISSKVIVGFTDPSNASFTGLIANKFNGKYNKPTILLRDTGYGSWSGSLRSPVPLATKINEGGLAKAQGHEEACGIFVQQNKFDEFRAWLETLDLSETPNVEVTAEVRPEDITLDVCQAVVDWNQLWGHGVEAPTFYLKFTLTQNNVYVFEKNSATIKIDLGCVNFIKFFATKADVEAFRKYSRFEIELVVGELSVNVWDGVKTPQAIIKKYEIVPQEDVWDEDSWMEDF